MSNNNAIVAVYNTHDDAQNAVIDLQKAGFDMKKLSIVGRDYQTEQHVVGYYNTGDRMRYWGKLGAIWGGLGGILLGTAFFLVPGIGPVLVAGPLAAYIASAVEGAVVVGGLSAVGGGLFSIGIPKNSILKYESALKADKFLLIAHGTRDQVQHAKEILRTTLADEVGVHLTSAPETTSVGGATS
jgi:uncharacterized membrane protein